MFVNPAARVPFTPMPRPTLRPPALSGPVHSPRPSHWLSGVTGSVSRPSDRGFFNGVPGTHVKPLTQEARLSNSDASKFGMMSPDWLEWHLPSWDIDPGMNVNLPGGRWGVGREPIVTPCPFPGLNILPSEDVGTLEPVFPCPNQDDLTPLPPIDWTPIPPIFWFPDESPLPDVGWPPIAVPLPAGPISVVPGPWGDSLLHSVGIDENSHPWGLPYDPNIVAGESMVHPIGEVPGAAYPGLGVEAYGQHFGQFDLDALVASATGADHLYTPCATPPKGVPMQLWPR